MEKCMAHKTVQSFEWPGKRNKAFTNVSIKLTLILKIKYYFSQR